MFFLLQNKEIFIIHNICIYNQVSFFENEFGWINQILIPAIFGALGCWIRLLVAMLTPEGLSIKKELQKQALKSYSWIFLLAGSLAGFAAVNLINPQGSFAQVSTLSLIAGLGGITFLLRSSLVEGVFEEGVLKSLMSDTLTQHFTTKDDAKFSEDLSIDELANMISRTYNIDRLYVDDPDDDPETIVEDPVTKDEGPETTDEDPETIDEDPETIDEEPISENKKQNEN